MPTPARILIVEDERIIALDLHQTLADCGYQVLGCVDNAEEAVEQAAALQPDLVMMDIRLRGNMTGLEAARQIYERYHIPSLFVTAFVDDEMLRQAKECEALGYVLKPFNERELAITVDIALHRARIEQELRQALQRPAPPTVPAEEPGKELSVTTLGSLQLRLGERMLDSTRLSRSQREILALVLASPQLSVPREEVELALWPDSPPERARSSFDSLLLRLRRNFAESLGTAQGKEFLSFRRGMLSLEHCQVDAVAFVRGVQKGYESLKRGDLAAAEGHYTGALDLWSGGFIPGVPGNERTEAFRRELQQMLHTCCRQLGTLLARSGRLEEAITVMQRALCADPGNDLLVAELYRLLLQANHPGQARQLLRHYGECLARDGFSPEEIEEALAEIRDGE